MFPEKTYFSKSTLSRPFRPFSTQFPLNELETVIESTSVCRILRSSGPEIPDISTFLFFFVNQRQARCEHDLCLTKGAQKKIRIPFIRSFVSSIHQTFGFVLPGLFFHPLSRFGMSFEWLFSFSHFSPRAPLGVIIVWERCGRPSSLYRNRLILLVFRRLVWATSRGKYTCHLVCNMDHDDER